MKFTEFNLHPDLHKGIEAAGYTTCMPVQQQVLSNAFGGNDLYVQSQTGTGKTAAFLIVIFHRMLANEALFKRKALIMAPTRELAVQIEEEAKTLGRHLPFKTGSFYGGVGYAQQEKLLRDNAQILVGTPGRVLDLNKTGKMNLMEISFLVLDEADRMFDMGFYPDLRKLIKAVPPAERRQTMLFSATLNAWVKNLAWEYTKGSKEGKPPIEIEIKPEIVTVEEITQILYHVPSEKKMQLLLGILKNEHPQSAIIFCNTKKQTEITAKRLKMNGYACEFIIGDLPQVKRLKIIDNVKNGKIKILAATDVAARGLDIDNLAMVINFDIPVEAENYVHRTGRTARAGKTGKAVSFVSEQDVYELPAIERYIGKKIPSEIAPQNYYDEDKSAGHYIRTEFSEEKNTPKRDRSTETRRTSGSRTSNEVSRGTSNEVSRGTSNKVSRSSHRGTDDKSFPQRPPKESQRSGGRADSSKQQEQDLSQLSMEERMALYRKKYAGGLVKHGRQRSDEELSSHNKPVMDVNTGQNASQEELSPVKKGIISKILGLFRK